ncbi:MAG: hypothetical protein KDC34_17040 [Saprospiraceae bacterium]|nr:hypothetical protein [Saprospiraceae bacterium]
MKTFRTLFFLILVLPLSGNAQTISGVLDTLAMLMPSSVAMGSGTLQQELKIDDANPCRIHLRSIETDSKGRMHVEDFYFHAADIDKEAVKSQSSRKSSTVEVEMAGRQPLIEHYKDQIPQDYTRSISFLAKDSKNAGQIEYQLKKLQGLCEADFKANQNYESEELDPLLDWMVENTRDVVSINGSITQVMTRKALETGEGIVLTRTSTNAKGETLSEVFSVNAGDLDGAAASLEIKGRIIDILVPVIAKQRYVYVKGSAGSVAFNQDLRIQVNTIEDGRSYLNVLALMTPMARELMQTRIKSLGDKTNALSKLQAKQLRFEEQSGSTQVKLSGDCLASWKIERKPEKGSGQTETYKVFLQDLEKAELVVTASTVVVQLETIDRLRYVEVLENGERQSFTNRFSLPVSDIETGKIVQYLIEKALAGCRTETPKVPGDKPTELMAFLRSQSGKKEGSSGAVNQSFTSVEADKPCMLRITQVKEAGRGGGEMVYELDLSDINPESVRLDINGKTIAVDFDTRRKETLIKAIKDGEPQGFESGLRVWAKDLEQARVMAYTIQSMAVGCSE